MAKYLNTAVFALALCAPSAAAATLPNGFTETLVTGGLSAPTAMTFAPDGRLFVCQQGGQLRVIQNGTLLPTPFVSLTVNSTGERGLLGVAIDGRATFEWTDPSLGAGTVVRAIHVAELRAALQDAYVAAGHDAPGFTDSTLLPQSSVIKAAHIIELREAIFALEGS